MHLDKTAFKIFFNILKKLIVLDITVISCTTFDRQEGDSDVSNKAIKNILMSL